MKTIEFLPDSGIMAAAVWSDMLHRWVDMHYTCDAILEGLSKADLVALIMFVQVRYGPLLPQLVAMLECWYQGRDDRRAASNE